MPNQNNPDPTKSGDAPVSIFPQSDLPPMISTPKKKLGGKIIATILGIFLLIGGVGAGLVLTSQNQNILEKADNWWSNSQNQPGTPDYEPVKKNPDEEEGGYVPIKDVTQIENYDQERYEGGSCPVDGGLGESADGSSVLRCSGDVWSAAGNEGDGSPCYDSSYCADGFRCSNGKCQAIDEQSCKSGDPGAPTCCNNPNNSGSCESGYTSVCESGPSGARSECRSPSGVHCTLAVGGKGSCGSSKTSDTSNSIPTPTPGPTAMCINVKAYSSTWTLLSSTNLSTLAVGTTINFCVAGTTTEGTFDKAQFKINTTLEPETTTVRPGSTDYCQSYTILSTDTTVNVQAKIHHATLGWFGETI